MKLDARSTLSSKKNSVITQDQISDILSESSTKKGNQIAQTQNEEEEFKILEVDESEDLNTPQGRKINVFHTTNPSSSLEGNCRYDSFNTQTNLYEITNKNLRPIKKYSAQNTVNYVNQFDQIIP